MTFNNLFILDLANNHQGDVDHALKIIDSMIGICPENTSIKLQLRDLETFIHPDHKQSKMAQRFLSTELRIDQFATIASHIKKSGFLLSCTPFDEISVRTAVNLGSDFLKVASCSANDWPLLEAISKANLPVVVSTGGLTVAEVDKVVSFCEHKGLEFAIHHCVSIYPTPLNQLNLRRITMLRERYPGLVIGWSTHEPPDAYTPIVAAYSLGARMFERHIGLKTDKYSVNAYSSEADQIDKWVTAFRGVSGMMEYDTLQAERENMIPLKRGLYDGKLAIPFNGITDEKPMTDARILKEAIHELKAILNYAHVHLPTDFEVEFSHHFGVKRFRETGVTMIEIFNRHYAKKLLIMLPGQSHPFHYHKIKDEAFHVLYGDLTVSIDGQESVLMPGETAIVPPGVWHNFSSVAGCVFEEVSTTSIAGDSVYRDPEIQRLKNDERKTKVRNWGRYQIQEKFGHESSGKADHDRVRSIRGVGNIPGVYLSKD